MAQLKELLDRKGDDRVFVAAFPIEDQSKTLEEIFPPSWIGQEGEPTVIPMLLAPPNLVKDLCNHMFEAGNDFLRAHFESITPDLDQYAETDD